MQNPLISIIIPTFNSGATLSVALQSIIHQTFINWEVVIMDGESADATLEIAKEYQIKFPNGIKINSEKDKGIYDAMNKGIDKAQGDWLYFMGSDDSLYETTTLEKISKLDALKNYDVVYGNVFFEQTKSIHAGRFTFGNLANYNICHQSTLIKKEVFKKIGNFNLKFKVHADWEHNIRWFFSSKISNIFINQTIANFADGGFSSLNVDEAFANEKSFLLLDVGFKKLSHTTFIAEGKKSINFAIQNKNYQRLLISFYKVIICYGLKVGDKITRIVINN